MCKNKFFSKIMLALIVSSSLSSFQAKAGLSQEESQGVVIGLAAAVVAKLVTSSIVEGTYDRHAGHGNFALAAIMGGATALGIMGLNKNQQKGHQFVSGLILYSVLLRAKLFNNHA